MALAALQGAARVTCRFLICNGWPTLTRQTPSKAAVVLRRHRALVFLLPLWWVLIVTALARPVWLANPIEKTESTRDLMLLVDLSGSMETEDFKDPQGKQISRLDAVKMVLGDFIERRKSDRLGLIVFGNEPYLQAPFTRDHEVVRTLLGQTKAKMAGPQTAIGDAIGLAIKHFESSKSEHRVVVLLTDGNDTGSKVPPRKAAEIASQRGITIHTVAVGDPTAAGEGKMDIEALQAISRTTKGSFFRADDRVAAGHHLPQARRNRAGEDQDHFIPPEVSAVSMAGWCCSCHISGLPSPDGSVLVAVTG